MLDFQIKRKSFYLEPYNNLHMDNPIINF